ncbi:hypothetical protein BV372_10620 [Nostoc sp. T09]|uniref:DUF5674 family protein n=1 Tax=Nostoc sp. T09 TaxID=1932621 RepID=UPI000A36F5F2|nr:DUF5674 family protein [Nostoc sp. T09]OUL35578.1 hypothetical protein BV372_10620 [Nostoc sp. T09]
MILIIRERATLEQVEEMLQTLRVAYESIINIRLSQNNRSMIIQDTTIRERVTQITKSLIGGYEPEFR